MSRSLHLRLLTPGTLTATVGTHSLHYDYTLQSHYASLADYPRLLKHFSLLHCLNYTTGFHTDLVFYAR
jgi:hypothetical protein